MNRAEAIRNLAPLFDLAIAQPVPVLREMALLATGMAKANLEDGPLIKGIHRRYLRLCRLQGELARLDLKKAKPGTTLEDFVFSEIDFHRYREIEGGYFETLFLEGLYDFDEAFFRENFFLEKKEVQSMIKKSYIKEDGLYRIQMENSMILSVIRTLETSLEDLPLFTPNDINDEMKKLPGFAGTGRAPLPPELRGMKMLYPLLVASLDGIVIVHEDGMETTLAVSAQGNLEGTFRPDNKPWTRVLIPNPQSASSPPTGPGQG